MAAALCASMQWVGACTEPCHGRPRPTGRKLPSNPKLGDTYVLEHSAVFAAAGISAPPPPTPPPIPPPIPPPFRRLGGRVVEGGKEEWEEGRGYEINGWGSRQANREARSDIM